MLRGLHFHHRLSGLAIAIGVLALSALPASAMALAPKAKGPLVPLLSELARPAVASKDADAQAEALGLAPDQPAGLVRDGDRVLVTARFGGGALASLADLREAGAEVVSFDRDQHTVTLASEPAALPAIAAISGVRSVWPLRQPLLRAAGDGPCEGGSVLSEGLGQLRVDEARGAFELRGKGVTVGVLSDSYDSAAGAATHAAEDIAANDLPGPASSCSEQQLPVNVLQELEGEGTDEGRAMLQIVHDLAPHAELAFATAFESEESFVHNIEALARPTAEGGAGAEVIVDDVSWFEEPFFQDGPVAVAVDEATAAGVTYLTAAGNDNLIDGSGRNIASWEAPAFRDSGACPASVASLGGFNGAHCMDFDPGGEIDRGFGITVQPGKTLTLDLQWAEPWNGVGTDLDAFLLSSGGQILTSSYAGNSGPTGTQRPVEILQWENTSGSSRTVTLAINRFLGLNPRLKFILMQNGGGVSSIEYPEPSGGDVVGPSIYGHAGAASAIALAAVPFSDSSAVERYSSRGPVTHYFGPVDGLTPALPLGTPEEVAKPDLAATDCGATSFFAFPSGKSWRFCGTSAAAPHAAAVAALLRQAKPTLPVQQVRSALTDTAAPVGTATPEAVGAGLVDAFAALSGLPGPIGGGDGPDQVLPNTNGAANPTPSGGTTGSAVVGPTPAPSPAPTPTPKTAPPSTTILRHPPKLVRTGAARARVSFRFGSDQAGATFLCKLDRAAFRPCAPKLVRRVKPGKHVLLVEARNAAGLTDPTPARFSFRVRQS